MYCQKCGKQLDNEAVVCIGCGCPVKNTVANGESSGLAVTATIFAILIPIIGIILGIVGCCTYKTPKFKSESIAAIFLSFAMMILVAALIFLISVL